jgi:hypothetical protein
MKLSMALVYTPLLIRMNDNEMTKEWEGKQPWNDLQAFDFINKIIERTKRTQMMAYKVRKFDIQINYEDDAVNKLD